MKIGRIGVWKGGTKSKYHVNGVSVDSSCQVRVKYPLKWLLNSMITAFDNSIPQSQWIIGQIKLVLALLIMSEISCSRIQEITPDLAKDVEGSYKVNAIFIADPGGVNNPLITSYYLADSMQTGQLQIRRIDRSKVSIAIGINKQNGDIVYTNSITADVSNSDKLNRLLTMKGPSSDGGAYDVNGQFVAFTFYSPYKGKSNIQFAITAFR